MKELTEELINEIDCFITEWATMAIHIGISYSHNEKPLDMYLKYQSARDYYQELLDGNGTKRNKYMPKYVQERLKDSGYVQEQ